MLFMMDVNFANILQPLHFYIEAIQDRWHSQIHSLLCMCCKQMRNFILGLPNQKTKVLNDHQSFIFFIITHLSTRERSCSHINQPITSLSHHENCDHNQNTFLPFFKLRLPVSASWN